MTPGIASRRQAVVAGLAAVTLAIAWQFLVVRYTTGGNWTSWFCNAANVAQPPELASDHIYSVATVPGYDSQFYHYMAHDPLLRRGFDRYIDAPRLRYRRILVPGLAYLAALGQDRFIDAALFAVNAAFMFAGAYWLSRYARCQNMHPALGVLFLAAPAVLVSLDRLTVDLALTALCVAFAVYVSEKRARELYLVLLLAPLARETGMLLIAAYCLALVLERQMKAAMLFATSTMPALAWLIFVQSRTAPYDSTGWFLPVPLAGVVDRLIHPAVYPFIPAVKWLALILDECALVGVILAFALSFRCPMKFPRPLALAAMLITLSGLTLGKPFWEDVLAFGRVFSPLVVLIALQSVAARSWLPVLPLALIDPRIGLQLGYKLFQIARALGG